MIDDAYSPSSSSSSFSSSSLFLKRVFRACGEKARMSNVRAVLAVSQMVSSSFGPRGAIKLFISEGQRGEEKRVTIKEDAIEMLLCLDVRHPVAKLAIDSALLQHAQGTTIDFATRQITLNFNFLLVGDGTIGTMLLIEALLEEMNKVLMSDEEERGSHTIQNRQQGEELLALDENNYKVGVAIDALNEVAKELSAFLGNWSLELHQKYFPQQNAEEQHRTRSLLIKRIAMSSLITKLSYSCATNVRLRADPAKSWIGNLADMVCQCVLCPPSPPRKVTPFQHTHS